MSLEPDKEAFFPNLRQGQYRITSAESDEYNCVAWAADDTGQWWEPSGRPGHYWPPGMRLEVTAEALTEVFESLGYQRCESRDPEDGYEKIAIYAAPNGHYTHAAKQLANGRWASKLGEWEDIEHSDLSALEGDGYEQYGQVVVIMKRSRQ